MPIRTRGSMAAPADMGNEGRGETNWAQAAAAAEEAASSPLHQDYENASAQNEVYEEDEEWVTPEGPEHDEDVHDETYTRHQTPWVLKVAIPGWEGHDDDDRGIACIFIDSGMTAHRLGRCISQAVSSPVSMDYSNPTSFESGPRQHNDGYPMNDNHRHSLVGLFGKDDRIFYSLECILAMNPEDGEKVTFCVVKPIRPMLAPRGPVEAENIQRGGNLTSLMTRANLFLVSGILVPLVVLLPTIIRLFDRWANYWHSALEWVPTDLPSMWKMVSFVLDWPAREMYRFGPSFIGWEGQDLTEICTQMNRRYYFVGYSGRGGNDYEDREYWRQNPKACETIYRMKEESFVRMCRPMWYLTITGLSFLALQRLIQIAIARPPPPQLPPTDRAVLDTYRALQFLLREHNRQEQWHHQQQQQQRTGMMR